MNLEQEVWVQNQITELASRNLELSYANESLKKALLNIRKRLRGYGTFSKKVFDMVAAQRYIDKVIEKNDLNEVKKETK